MTASLCVANRIGEEIGFSGSDYIAVAQGQYWKAATQAFIPSGSNLILSGLNHAPLSGALQEVRYWDTPLSESFFFDYVVNPYSTQGTGVNTAPDELMFRADLGTELNTGSRTSIHPKVTGSWAATESFASTSDFYLTGSFIQNTESIYLNQTPGGIKNRITDKVHIVNTTIPSGSTLSPYRSVQQTAYPSGSAPNINYLEVAFSPQDQINDDIIAQIGDFNLGDYIGDPRQISESSYSYPELDALRDAYFTKYINSYNVNDFVRLIKFFDNSLFKMVKDFTPARTSLSSGVVIKQNLLERNKQAPPSMSYTTPEYSGSVKSFARNYQVPNSNKRVIANANQQALASSSAPQYSDTSGSSIYVFSGGTGGVFEPFNNLYAAPLSQSNINVCIEPYFYSESIDYLEPNSNIGEFLLTNIDASNTTNTMSLNIQDSGLQNHNALLSLVSESSGNNTNYVSVKKGSNPNQYMKWRIDQGIYYGGYGFDDSEYGDAPYGDYTSQYQFYLTVEENNLGGFPQYSDLSNVIICFDIAGDPYSGLTETEISESIFFQLYPGFTQAWSESIVPGLGIAMPNELYPNTSNGYSPVNYPRIDQREFYNGEFGNPINVEANEICKAFFGQDNIPPYLFLIQWFNETSFPLESFLLPGNLPQAGNVWFWANTVNAEGELTTTIPTLNISQNINSTGAPGPAVDFIITNRSSDDGVGQNASFRIYSNPFIAGNRSVYIQPLTNSPGNSFLPGQTITILQSTMISGGATNCTQDVIITLTQGDVANGCSNKVEYIKMSNVDVNGLPINPFIQDSEYVDFNLTGASDYDNNLIEGYQTYFISNTIQQDDEDPNTENAVLIIVNEQPSSDAVNSFDTSFYDLTFSASGYFSYYATSSGEDPNVIPSTGITESVPQGFFPPVPTFPTESFFRGWGESTYFQTEDDGGLIRIGSADGFSSDELGNFNTGSYELDNDNEVPYVPSVGPWFMNAKPATTMALSASSTLGFNGPEKLQFYTGSITASSVPIGPRFNILLEPTPTEANLTLITNSNPPPPGMSISCPNQSFGASGNTPRSIVVSCGSQQQQWQITVTDFDGTPGGNWMNAQIVQGNPGNGTVSVIPDSSTYSTGAVWGQRSCRVYVESINSTLNFSQYCVFTQDYWSGGDIPDNPFPPNED